MLLRLLLSVCAFLPPMSFAQSPTYGTATGHPKADDPAPDLVFSQLLSAPVPGSWTPANLSGQVTVLSFFPDTSHNPQLVADWNARLKQYADRHVQFVWITGEHREKLMPALAQHPVAGWVLYDPDGSTAKAYGLETPVTVYIGPDRKIVGFDHGFIPDERTLSAVLDGRITHTRPTQSTLKAFIQSDLVVLDTEPSRVPRANDHRPKFAPSYTVHITPSAEEKNGISSSDEFLVLEGVTLKGAIERLYDVNPIRILLPTSLDNENRFDFALLLPTPEGQVKMMARMKKALQEHFHVTLDRERRLTDVYVMSASPGRSPAALPIDNADDHGYIRDSSIEVRQSRDLETAVQGPGSQGVESISGLSEDGTMDDLCRDLEASLNRPVVNETGLKGEFHLQVQVPNDSNEDDFLQRLRKETGLVIASGQRTVEFLDFQPVR